MSILENLLSQFDVNRPGRRGWTPVMKTAVNGGKWIYTINDGSSEGGKKEAYDLLATRGADKPLLTSKGDNVLHAACQGGNLAIVKEVVDSFDINCRGKDGHTPLMRAVCGGHIAVYKYLVSRRADRGLVDKEGHTLLHLASRHGQLAVLKHIVDGFDVNTQDNMSLTPAMTAVLC
ncbi:ankyrin repeat-containing protein C6C3.08-like [Haliotis rubra]|uniref:ankyrin repeat-containing protein C6C3.08-like n=1 Tax=Haliotis rubra TaxID=36100 RepID=UPI001EE5EBD1|nr:ankyrin repeat-containing protein C6C3.08-like [Haliotis rubra]